MGKGMENRMTNSEISFAIDILSHPQSADDSDLRKAINISIEALSDRKKQNDAIDELVKISMTPRI